MAAPIRLIPTAVEPTLSANTHGRATSTIGTTLKIIESTVTDASHTQAQTKESFVSHDVQRRLRGIAVDHELRGDIKLGKDCRDNGQQVSKSNNSC